MKPIHLDTDPKIKPGFEVPNGYFESFENKLFNELLLERESKVISIHRPKTKWYWMAAAIIVFAIILPIYNHLNSAKLILPTSDEIEFYVNINPSITSDDIISQLSMEDIKAMQVKSDLKTENIENYLLETESIEYYLLD